MLSEKPLSKPKAAYDISLGGLFFCIKYGRKERKQTIKRIGPQRKKSQKF
jgi:hypothetical protein